MTDRKVMHQALDALERAAVEAASEWSVQKDWNDLLVARLAVEAAIAQPEQTAKGDLK